MDPNAADIQSEIKEEHPEGSDPINNDNPTNLVTKQEEEEEEQHQQSEGITMDDNKEEAVPALVFDPLRLSLVIPSNKTPTDNQSLLLVPVQVQKEISSKSDISSEAPESKIASMGMRGKVGPQSIEQLPDDDSLKADKQQIARQCAKGSSSKSGVEAGSEKSISNFEGQREEERSTVKIDNAEQRQQVQEEISNKTDASLKEPDCKNASMSTQGKLGPQSIDKSPDDDGSLRADNKIPKQYADGSNSKSGVEAGCEKSIIDKSAQPVLKDSGNTEGKREEKEDGILSDERTADDTSSRASSESAMQRSVQDFRRAAKLQKNTREHFSKAESHLVPARRTVTINSATGISVNKTAGDESTITQPEKQHITIDISAESTEKQTEDADDILPTDLEEITGRPATETTSLPLVPATTSARWVSLAKEVWSRHGIAITFVILEIISAIMEQMSPQPPQPPQPPQAAIMEQMSPQPPQPPQPPHYFYWHKMISATVSIISLFLAAWDTYRTWREGRRWLFSLAFLGLIFAMTNTPLTCAQFYYMSKYNKAFVLQFNPLPFVFAVSALVAQIWNGEAIRGVVTCDNVQHHMEGISRDGELRCHCTHHQGSPDEN